LNRKTLLAVAAMAAFAASATTAQAQSSVTLYGLIDAGISYVNHAAVGTTGSSKNFKYDDGVSQGSRWGLRGAEDLGGGLKAIFDLQNGFDDGTGQFQQGGDLFGRRAFVGLSSDRWGALTFGRQYDSVVDYVGGFAAAEQWLGNIGAHASDIDEMATSYRANNSIKYASPDYHGLSFGGLYALGGVAGSVGTNQIFTLGAKYSAGPASVGIAYANVKNPNHTFWGNNSIAPTNNLAMTSPIYSGYASAATQQIIAVGGSLTFGLAKVGVVYTNVQFLNLGNINIGPTRLANGKTVASGSSGHFNDAEVNFRYQLTPALVLGAAYNYTGENGIGDASYNQFSLGADYALSKSTIVYAIGSYLHASGTNSQGVSAVSDIQAIAPSNSNEQAIFRLGITKLF
jgi:predicted porin